ncbi:MAG: DegV family protein [Clostridia bacterium]|nr:DegV family protein [Clostridia bacterium]
MTKTKIVADSSCDIFNLENISFETAPLKIITSQKEYVDNDSLNVLEMVDFLQNYKGKSSTSCPNADDWLSAFGDAENVFCVTITGTLSGSYNSAMLAKKTYEETYPDRKVFVLDSLTTGPEMHLIIEKLQELITAEKEFDEVCREIKKYSKRTGLLFMLQSMKNLANNGRISPIAAKMAGILGIRMVGKASDKGDLEALDKCRGEKNALENIVKNLKVLGLSHGSKVKIAHCFNEEAGKQLKKLIQKNFSKVQVAVYECRGLCSFYAEKGGLLIGFEKASETI